MHGFSWGGEQETDGSLTATTLDLTMPASSASALIAEALVSKKAIQTATLSCYELVVSQRGGEGPHHDVQQRRRPAVPAVRHRHEPRSVDHVKIAFHSVDFASTDGTDYTWTLPIVVP